MEIPALITPFTANFQRSYSALGDFENFRRAMPLAFNNCFAWLHRAKQMQGQNTAILICPGLNHDALNSHHANRLLADQLADMGYPVIRFDYPHTGDSCDVPGYNYTSANDLWQIWLDAVDQAADILRTKTGATKLILCGLRIGATMAALTASTRRDIAGLILLAPVIRGQSYLRQIWIEAQLHNVDLPPVESGLQFQDICLNDATVGSLGKVDLRNIPISPGIKTALIAQTGGRLTHECCSAWRQKGAIVDSIAFDGLEPMLSLNVEDNKEHPNFDRLLTWVHQEFPPTGNVTLPEPTHEGAYLMQDGWLESPLFFGEGRRLFGILCRPAYSDSRDIVIIANAGRDPRHGPGRFHVEFARGLARSGVASLRLDFAGLGDSLGLPGREDLLSSLFDQDRSSDLSAAIDALGLLGFERFAAYGLCAGAYHVMRAAVIDDRLSRLLLVNIPLFSWTGGESIDFIRHRNLPLRHFVSEFLKLKSWTIAKTKLAKSGSVLRGQFRRFIANLRNAVSTSGQGLHPSSKSRLTEGQRNIAVLLNRNVKTLLLFGEGDLGLEAIDQEFGAVKPQQDFGGNMALRILPGLDHLISQETSRVAAAQCMQEFLASSAGD